MQPQPTELPNRLQSNSLGIPTGKLLTSLPAFTGLALLAGLNPLRGFSLFLLAGAVLLTGCASTSGGSPGPSLFERHEVVTGISKGQSVLTGFFLDGNMADIAVIEKKDRRLSLYAFEGGTWVSRLETTLHPEVRFVDVAQIEGRDRLITFEGGQFHWFDPDTVSERPLVVVSTSYNATPWGLHYAGTEPLTPAGEHEIPQIDITRDLNRDGLDDLILPDLDGFWVILQRPGGGFSEPVKLGPPEPFRYRIAHGDERRYGQIGLSPLTIPWYLSRVHELDYDQDGRSDLVFWNEEHFEVYLQETNGQFSAEAEIFEVGVPFDSDGAYSILFSFEDLNAFSLVTGIGKKTKRTILRSTDDLNGDGIADLLIHSLEGRGLKQQSRYAVHYGSSASNGIEFSKDPSTVVEPQGNAGAGELAGYSNLWLRDFDGDDQTDILRADVNFGIGGILRVLFSRSLSLGAELYRMNDGVYPTEVSTRQKIKVDLKFGDGRDTGFFPPIIVGDVNGDGRSDLLVGTSREELQVFLGAPGPGLFAPEPLRVSVSLPGDERNSWLADLNRDGKQDVLMLHPSLTEPHRITLLMAQ